MAWLRKCPLNMTYSCGEAVSSKRFILAILGLPSVVGEHDRAYRGLDFQNNSSKWWKLVKSADTEGRTSTVIYTTWVTFPKGGNRPVPMEWKRILVGRQLLCYDVAQLSTTSSAMIIQHTNSIFARHDTPEVLVSGNGPQYTSSVTRHLPESTGSFM